MEFYTIITDAGRAAVANAIATGGKVDLVQLAAGDGGGQAVQPVPSQQALAGEVWRGELSTYTVDGDVLTLSSFIPAEAMAFTLREMGVFTADGMLFAVCNTPEIRHVPPEEGVVGDLTLGMQLKISTLEQDALTIQTNPDLDFIPNREKGAAGGVAPLGPDGKVPEEYLPETDAFTNDEILDQETATDIGLGPGAVPADMFNVLAHIGDLHVWRRTIQGKVDYPVSTNRNAYQEGTSEDGKPAGYTLGSVKVGSFFLTEKGNQESRVGYHYQSSVKVADDGTISLPQGEGYGTLYFNYNTLDSNSINAVKGKFIQKFTDDPSDFGINNIYFIPNDAVVSRDVGTTSVYVNKYQPVTSYPATPPNTTIEYLGNLGDKKNVQIVRYYGTGTYGAGNPCSIKSDFMIKALYFIGSVDKSSSISEYLFERSVPFMLADELTTSYKVGVGISLGQERAAYSWGKKSSDGKTFYWYADRDAMYQGNKTNVTYYFLCIG